jgi:acetyltransferase-like isoleucine patch superfamily enzyme
MARLDKATFGRHFFELITNRKNRFHPMVWINGTPEIGKNVYIGLVTEINGKGARLRIGDHCDIASFCSINVADSHRRAIGLANETDRQDIVIGHHVFIGSHSVVLGGATIGHHSVVAAGTVVRPGRIPPYSLVIGNPMVVKPRYYAPKRCARR